MAEKVYRRPRTLVDGRVIPYWWAERAYFDDGHVARMGPYCWDVLTFLMREANEQHRAMPQLKTIAEACGISRDRALKSIAELLRLGYIKKSVSGAGRSRVTVYEIQPIVRHAPGVTPPELSARHTGANDKEAPVVRAQDDLFAPATRTPSARPAGASGDFAPAGRAQMGGRGENSEELKNSAAEKEKDAADSLRDEAEEMRRADAMLAGAGVDLAAVVRLRGLPGYFRRVTNALDRLVEIKDKPANVPGWIVRAVEAGWGPQTTAGRRGAGSGMLTVGRQVIERGKQWEQEHQASVARAQAILGAMTDEELEAVRTAALEQVGEFLAARWAEKDWRTCEPLMLAMAEMAGAQTVGGEA